MKRGLMGEENFDKPKIYINGKEVGEVTKYEKFMPTSRTQPPSRPNFSYSASFTLSEEDEKKLKWLLDEPKRIKKYIEQIFRFQKQLKL